MKTYGLVEIDSRRRVTLKKPLFDDLELDEGDELYLAKNDGKILLFPVSEAEVSIQIKEG